MIHRRPSSDEHQLFIIINVYFYYFNNINSGNFTILIYFNYGVRAQINTNTYVHKPYIIITHNTRVSNVRLYNIITYTKNYTHYANLRYYAVERLLFFQSIKPIRKS